MKALQFLMFVALSVGAVEHGMAQGGVESKMDALRSLLKTGAVTKVEVLRMPDTVMTRVAVTPQALRLSASYTVIFNEDIVGTFEPLLVGVSPKVENHNADLRWGVLFYDAQNHETGSLFVDKAGQYGYLNGETVSFDTGFLDASLAKRLHKIIGNLR
jgi:hypothetical protein